MGHILQSKTPGSNILNKTPGSSILCKTPGSTITGKTPASSNISRTISTRNASMTPSRGNLSRKSVKTSEIVKEANYAPNTRTSNRARKAPEVFAGPGGSTRSRAKRTPGKNVKVGLFLCLSDIVLKQCFVSPGPAPELLHHPCL